MLIFYDDKMTALLVHEVQGPLSSRQVGAHHLQFSSHDHLVRVGLAFVRVLSSKCKLDNGLILCAAADCQMLEVVLHFVFASDKTTSTSHCLLLSQLFEQ